VSQRGPARGHERAASALRLVSFRWCIDTAALWAQAARRRWAVRSLETAFFDRWQRPIAADRALRRGRVGSMPGKARMLDRSACSRCSRANQAVQASKRRTGRRRPHARRRLRRQPGWAARWRWTAATRTLYGEQSDRVKPFTILMGMQQRGRRLDRNRTCAARSEHDLLDRDLLVIDRGIGEAWMRVACGQLEIAIAGGWRPAVARDR